MKFELPEKEYFSHQELADRWGCDLKQVAYYVSEGVLREGVDITGSFFSTVQVCNFYRCPPESLLFQSFTNNFYLYDDVQAFFKENESLIDFDNVVKFPSRFFYISNLFSMLTDETDYSLMSQYEYENHGPPDTRHRMKFLVDFHDFRYIPIWKRGKVRDKFPWESRQIFIHESDVSRSIVPREERDRFESGLPIGAEKPKSVKQENLETGMTQTTENGYLVTIALLARMLAGADSAYLKHDGSINVKGLAEALEKSSMGISGHRAEALKKRIAAGLKTLKDLS